MYDEHEPGERPGVGDEARPQNSDRIFGYWRKAPTLFAYINRVGAKPVHPTRFTISVPDELGYTREKASIRIKPDRTIECSHPELAPTAEEAQAIARELENIVFPQTILASKASVDRLREKIGKDGLDRDPVLFEYLNQTGKGIICVQQRRDIPEKAYVFWSLYDDNQWYPSEPSGDLLPLFGLNRLNDLSWHHNRAAVMLHEGAKAAEAAHRIVAEKRDHPWSADLAGYVHLGWPGGAPNSHRVDWGPLRRLSPDVRIVMVCDHDDPGEKAASDISKLLAGRQLGILRFDERFPRSFDCADPFPGKLYRDGKYVGPSLEDCLSPATWATRWVIPQGGGQPTVVATDAFAQEWIYVAKPNIIVFKQDVRLRLDRDQFNLKIRPFSHVKDTASVLAKCVLSSADKFIYDPALPSGLVAHNGERAVNVYRPSPIKPTKGDVGRFIAYMEHLIPDEKDRHEVMRWIATLIARPDIRMRYGLLLISRSQGVGKTTLGAKILAPILGVDNCSFPSVSEVTESRFTTWRAFKQLAIIEEIYCGENKKAYNRLKDVISNDTIRMEEKYLKAFDIENKLQVFASSNSPQALKIEASDRRWLIPKVADSIKPPEYWEDFHHWLDNGGLEAIAQWAHDFVKTDGHPIHTGEHAPASYSKRDVYESCLSPAESLMHDICDNLRECAPDRIIRLDRLREYVNHPDHQNPYPVTAEKVAATVHAAGLTTSAQFKIAGRKVRVASLFDIKPGTRWSEIAHLEKQPETLVGPDGDTPL